MISSEQWIRMLKLHPHPEGGAFRETYRADAHIPAAAVPFACDSVRTLSTAIYFLLEGKDFSAFHRIQSDEIWHFYYGSSLTLHLLSEDGMYSTLSIGPKGDLPPASFQAVIPAGVWFAATVDNPASYALVGCTVAPGFEFDDFELGNREALIRQYPGHADIIKRLTRV